MPKYSVLEVILIENPDFDQLALLDTKIEEKVKVSLEEIVHYLENLRK